MRHLFHLFPLVILAACNGNEVKDTLGLSREAPDEYRVVTRPPLSVPPEFNLQPPNEPGEVSSAQATDKQAKSLLTGKPAEDSNTFKLQPANAPVAPVKITTPAAKTSPEANFLQKAGAVDADPNVRAAIERDKIAQRKPAEEEGESRWWDPTSWWASDKKEPQVDAQAEKNRLKKNKDEGKPITEGETPEAQTHDTGVLGKILGY